MHHLTHYRYWIFDLDGTLTQPAHDFDLIRSKLGIPEGQDILGYIAQQPDSERERLNSSLSLIEEQIAGQAQRNNGVLELLGLLREQGCHLGILTRNKRHCVDITLEKIGCAEFFAADAIVASENAPPKPAPAGVRHLLSLWRANPSEALIMGDYRFDLEAGKAAGVNTIHLAPDNAPLWEQYTDLRVKNFAELLTYFRQDA